MNVVNHSGIDKT